MNFTIGLSGLQVAQRAIEIVGTNIANVSTDGYHRQEVEIAPLATNRMNGVPVGGAEISRYSRAIDTLLEQEILTQQPQFAQVSQELSSLQALQGAFGDLDSRNLTATLMRFFGSLRELAADPRSQPLREQAVWAADALANQFRSLGTFLRDLQEQVRLEAGNLAEQANGLAEQIADLTTEIAIVQMRGGNANLAIDQRDEAILRLAELVPVSVVQRQDGSGGVDVLAWGTPVVTRSRTANLVIGQTTDGDMGIGVEDGLNFDSEARGGKIGGLLALKNDLLSSAQRDLDALAAAVVGETNRLHVQGVGTYGSFTELTGSRIGRPDAALSTWDWPVTPGRLHLRLIAPDGTATGHTVYIDAASDTLQTVAAALGAVDPAHLTASVVDQRLRLEANAGWKIDFIQAPDLKVGTPWNGTSAMAISGIYEGAANDTYTFTVAGSGQVGVTEGLAVKVRNGAGELVRTLDVGAGYAAEDELELDHGLTIRFGRGDLVDGEQFSLDAVSDSDPTGFLAAAGINTLFEGRRAVDVAVRSEVLDDPRRLATARGAGMIDNALLRSMADVGETALDSLGGASPADAFRLLVTGVGQKIALREARRDALQTVMQQLEAQRESVSGVDINEEAAKLLIFERMFQGMAKVLSTQQKAMQTIIDLL